MHKLEWRQVYTFFSHKWCETRWGAVPRLFNVYLNELLSKLRENGLGCHMNGQFVGTFIYADDITRLAPSHSSLQSMLTICDQYASRHHLIFNPTKTKCMFFPTNKNMKQCPVIFKNESIEFC